ncbi:hypothetical protein [Haloplanus pelagicus]|jgi:hypothetical protein|uniref:hypothetical protein n=1 Tax=Haloplanus pelagicus TaxID=2949995 RepID=UPI003CE46BFB
MTCDIGPLAVGLPVVGLRDDPATDLLVPLVSMWYFTSWPPFRTCHARSVIFAVSAETVGRREYASLGEHSTLGNRRRPHRPEGVTTADGGRTADTAGSEESASVHTARPLRERPFGT